MTMSTTEPAAATVPATRKRSGWRRFFVGSALIAAGVIIGVGTTAFSQGGPRHDGDGPGRYFGERYDGDRGMGSGRRGWNRDDDDRGWRRGWFSRDDDGPRGWGRGMHGGHGMHGGGGPFGGGAFLTPGRVERMVDRLAWAVDASSEQKQKLAAIAQRTADETRGLRDHHLDLRNQVRDVLAAPTVDRGKLDALRAEHLKLAEEASRKITTALSDAADVLTPQQRADLARRLERWSNWRRG
jgi:periplasmic protein CpxP/Spy